MLDGSLRRLLALNEIDSFFLQSGKVIIPFTVKEILNEHLAVKLA